MFELFDHTADLGLRSIAPTLDEAFADLAKALTAAVVSEPEQLQTDVFDKIEIDGDDLEYLAFDWLRELLDRFERGRVAYREFDVRLAPGRLLAVCRGQRLSDDSIRLEHEVKAITYHGLKVEHTNDNWVIEVVVDI